MATAHQAEQKRLIAETRRYARESKAKSWFYVGTTFGLLIAGYATLLYLPGVWLRLLLAPLVGLLLVRAFILFHDFQHGAILRGSKLANALFEFFGWWILTPSGVWRYTHNYHHAHTAKMAGSHIGSFPLFSVDIYNNLSRTQRIRYALARHPLTILFGYFTVFHVGMCIAPFIRSPRENLSCLWATVFHIGVGALVYAYFGLVTFLLAFLLPIMIAHAVGGYLFYAQHNFDQAHIQPRRGWSYSRAALESSSYMKMGSVMHWFTGNIGYHHVHHLNQRIPFYRLPEAMSDIEALQTPGITTWRPRDIAACFRCKLWDAKAGRMVGFPQ